MKYIICIYVTTGPQHVRTLVSAMNLAHLYSAQKKFSQALPLYQQCYDARKQQLGEWVGETQYFLVYNCIVIFM